MKLPLTELRSVRQWRAATGLDATRFHALVPLFAAAYQRLYGAPIAERLTINPLGATFADEAELLFFPLFSLKSGLTYAGLGLGVRPGWLERPAPAGSGYCRVERRAAGRRLRPQAHVSDRGRVPPLLRRARPLLLDATEQRTQRPGDKTQQRGQYSGKKKPTPSKPCS
jgi:hypothetical protein